MKKLFQNDLFPVGKESSFILETKLLLLHRQVKGKNQNKSLRFSLQSFPKVSF